MTVVVNQNTRESRDKKGTTNKNPSKRGIPPEVHDIRFMVVKSLKSSFFIPEKRESVIFFFRSYLTTVSRNSEINQSIKDLLGETNSPLCLETNRSGPSVRVRGWLMIPVSTTSWDWFGPSVRVRAWLTVTVSTISRDPVPRRNFVPQQIVPGLYLNLRTSVPFPFVWMIFLPPTTRLFLSLGDGVGFWFCEDLGEKMEGRPCVSNLPSFLRVSIYCYWYYVTLKSTGKNEGPQFFGLS